jgi:hypothetical protein
VNVGRAEHDRLYFKVKEKTKELEALTLALRDITKEGTGTRLVCGGKWIVGFIFQLHFFPNTIALGLDMFSNDEERLCANKSVSRRPLFLMGSNIQEMEDAITGKMLDLEKVMVHSLGA